jgi:nucleotide-binding universal stress UspA family protein
MKTILVALDNSPTARQVLGQAVTLAKATGARLVMFRAGNLPLELEVVRSPDGQRFLERIREEVARDLEALRHDVPSEVRVSTRVEAGPAASTICEAARAEGADLVVLGSQGLGERAGGLSVVAARVLSEAGRSVLVVHVRA